MKPLTAPEGTVRRKKFGVAVVGPVFVAINVMGTGVPTGARTQLDEPPLPEQV
jgi:hypothetical protein